MVHIVCFSILKTSFFRDIIQAQRGDTNVQVHFSKCHRPINWANEDIGIILPIYIKTQTFHYMMRSYCGSDQQAFVHPAESEVTNDVRYQEFTEMTLDRDAEKQTVKGHFFFMER